MVKKKNKELQVYGDWAFIAGLVLVIIASVVMTNFSPSDATIKVLYGIIAVLGIIVGLLNITKEEVTSFLISVLVFLITGSFMGQLVAFYLKGSNFFSYLFNMFYAFVAPAGFIVAIISIIKSASTK